MAEHYEDLERSYGPREARRIAEQRGLDVPSDDESDERLKCLLIGVLLDDEGARLESAAVGFRDSEGNPGFQANYWGTVADRVGLIDQLMTRSEACGMGANGYLAGEFAGLEEQVKREGNKINAQDLVESVREFRSALRDAAEEPEVATGEVPFSRKNR